MSDFDHLLGVVSDREVARRYAVNQKTVQDRRARLGIPPLTVGFEPVGVPWDEISFVLGWFLDPDVAAAADVSTRSVRMARIGRGIPPLLIGCPSQAFLDAYPGRHPRGWKPNPLKPFEAHFIGRSPDSGLKHLSEHLRQHRADKEKK